jgi:hypothetical protein
MRNETEDGAHEIRALIARLEQERDMLKARVRVLRCGIQGEWEKAEAQWRRLRAANRGDSAWQLAQDLKNSYVRIYRGLLLKSGLLLDRLKHIGQKTDAASLQNLKRQAVAELTAIRLRLEMLGGPESLHFPPDEAPLCACLKCKQEMGGRPFDPDLLLAEAGQYL